MARDWITLVHAWKPDFPKLIIVTSLIVPQYGANIEVIRGDWRSCLLSDERIRELYWGSRFVVIPLHETIQPAGQSVCLQAMACGKPVIISDIGGIWDRNFIRDGETVLLTPPGDAVALAEKVQLLLSDRVLAERLARLGRAVIEKHLNVDIMAMQILNLIRRDQKVEYQK